MIKKIDTKNKYISMFDSRTGFYARTGVIENGVDTGVDPFMSSFPELIDIGVMGHCIHGTKGLCVKSGVHCYQSGLTKRMPNMSLENFKKIIDECKGKVFQVALGGRGDVNKHENFEELVAYCRQNGIVPNYTTSGLDLTPEEVAITKKYCGAVAVSWYRSAYTYKAISAFVDAGCITNIHYVLGNFSLHEAIDKMCTWSSKPKFPKGINAVIFLLHKPVGLGSEKDVLAPDSPDVKRFFSLVDEGGQAFKIGFDSCSIPAILNYTKKVSKMSTDTCEGARWSMYISADMVALPCSFDQDEKWGVPLINGLTVQSAWDSEKFENFRSSFRSSCPSCSTREECRGGCPIKNQIVLCAKPERTICTNVT